MTCLVGGDVNSSGGLTRDDQHSMPRNIVVADEPRCKLVGGGRGRTLL